MPVMTKTPKGDDIVILSRAEYDALAAKPGGEDAADAAHANQILARIANGSETLLTSKQADALLAAKTPLTFWRKHRGMTQQALAKRVGVAQGFVSEIENGSKTGDVQTLAAIAGALDVSLDDLIVLRQTRSRKSGSRISAIKPRAGGRRKVGPDRKNSKSGASARG
jgi:DNA-binding XRE family transcriptional regulator